MDTFNESQLNRILTDISDLCKQNLPTLDSEKLSKTLSIISKGFEIIFNDSLNVNNLDLKFNNEKYIFDVSINKNLKCKISNVKINKPKRKPKKI